MDPNTAPVVINLPAAITAVGALGTAAFGLVDTLKVLPCGGISNVGFAYIRDVVKKLAPEDAALKDAGLSYASLIETLHSHWINGTHSADQLNIAKSLIKLRLTTETAEKLAKETGVDGGVLKTVAEKIKTGTKLEPQESDVYGRFDLLLTTLLDQAYQRADQLYRNAAKLAAVPIAVGLALAATYVVPSDNAIPKAILIGLISTPIAPMAKDLSSAIATGVQALQAWKK